MSITKKARKLRVNSTDAEKILWRHLRNRQIKNMKFRRQHPFPPYILDFFNKELKLAIEIDGGQHNEPEQEEYDKKRTKFLEENGVTIIRFWNNEILENIDGVLQRISENINANNSTR